MTCPEAEVLSCAADGQLAPPELESVVRHARGCRSCREVLDEERALRAALGRAACPDPETLAAFIDDAGPHLERVAAHVLACDPCREVVAWTRDAQAQAVISTGRSSGRRRPRIVKGGRAGLPTWLPGLAAAAAAILVVVAISRPDRRPSDTAQVRPTPRPAPTTPAPRPPVAPAPGPTTPTTPVVEPEPTAPVVVPEPTTPVVEPEPATPIVPEPEPTTPSVPEPTPAEPGPSQTRDPEPATPEPVAVAALGPGLRWRAPGGAEGALEATSKLAPGSRILGGRPGGGFRLGQAACVLPPQADVSVEAPLQDGGEAIGRVVLHQGSLSVDSPDGGIEVACGPAMIRAGEHGVCFVLERDGQDGALLLVVSGDASVAAGGASARVGAGEAASFGRDRVRPLREGDARRVQDLAVAAEVERALDVPAGLRASRALTETGADLAASDAARRARAAHVVLALAAAPSPRLARLAQQQLAAAAAALDALQADPTALPPGALAPTTLAIVARARRAGSLVQGEARTLAALGDRMAALPAERVTGARPAGGGEERAPDGRAYSTDVEVLVALRAIERATDWRSPRAPFAAAAAQPLEPEAASVARALLARRPVDATARKDALAAIDRALAQDPLVAPVAAASVLAADRALALLGAWTPERRRALVAHAAASATAPEQALALAQDAALALGLEPAAPDEPASIVATRLPDGRYRVTFLFQSARRPKQVLIYGTWDAWSEPVALRERADGQFAGSIVLPAGRHEYKARLGVGGVWETDARNALETADGRGGLNSVLVLE